MLPASDPRPPQHWLSCAGTASKRAVYAGYIRPRRLARRPALPFLSPLLQISRPVLVLGRSIPFFRAPVVSSRFNFPLFFFFQDGFQLSNLVEPIFRLYQN